MLRYDYKEGIAECFCDSCGMSGGRCASTLLNALQILRGVLGDRGWQVSFNNDQKDICHMCIHKRMDEEKRRMEEIVHENKT